MPKRHPPELKRDVVAVARTSGPTHAQIAENFGIPEHSVQRWLRQADVDDLEFGYRFIADELHVACHQASEDRVHRLSVLQQIASSILMKRRGERQDAGSAGPRRPRLSGLPRRAARSDLVDRHLRALHARRRTLRRRGHGCLLTQDRQIRARRQDNLAPARCGATNRDRPLVSDRHGGGFGPRQSDSITRYQRTLRDHGLVCSIGRVSSAGDNAAMESFFSLLQKNVLDRQTWTTREDLRLANIAWIERTCHQCRRQRALGMPTPVVYEASIGYHRLTKAS